MKLLDNFLFLSLVVALTVVRRVTANVMGLDFGSDSMKVAIVQPGTPLEIG
jgi:hypothetical protein